MIHNGVPRKRMFHGAISQIGTSSGLAVAAGLFASIVGDRRTHEERRRM